MQDEQTQKRLEDLKDAVKNAKAKQPVDLKASMKRFFYQLPGKMAFLYWLIGTFALVIFLAMPWVCLLLKILYCEFHYFWHLLE